MWGTRALRDPHCKSTMTRKNAAADASRNSDVSRLYGLAKDYALGRGITPRRMAISRDSFQTVKEGDE